MVTSSYKSAREQSGYNSLASRIACAVSSIFFFLLHINSVYATLHNILSKISLFYISIKEGYHSTTKIKLFHDILLIIIYTKDNAASSATTVTSGWNCKIEAGTFGVTGPKNASFTI